MNLLTTLPPRTVWVDGQEYPINWELGSSVAFESLILNDAFSEEEKIQRALELYYPTRPHDLSGAVEQMLWFYRCGQDSDQPEHSSSDVCAEPAYSFEHDSDSIYAAFLDQYGIDLHTERIHWWDFRALFKSLRPDNEICRIMGIRSMKITSDMSAEQKEYYRKMKQAYRLPLSGQKQKRISALEEALLSGGDLKEVLS